MNARTALLTVAVGLLLACSYESVNSNPNLDNAEPLAQIAFNLAGGDFSSASVNICGSRSAPDPKYRCNNSISDTGCQCLNFDMNGNLIDPMTGMPGLITGLCPSSDLPANDWTFTYTIFAEPDCNGTPLNTSDNNFTCFDSHDFLSQANPNQSVEALQPGLTTNHVLCVTNDGAQESSFARCTVTTTSADFLAGEVRYQCGCTPTEDSTCDCGPGGVSPSDLEMGCSFDSSTCDILCPGGAAPVCTSPSSFFFVGNSGSSFTNPATIPAGQFIWFNVSFTPPAFSSVVHIYLRDLELTLNDLSTLLPDAVITLDPALTTATTMLVPDRSSPTGTIWMTAVPTVESGQVFATAVALQLPVDVSGTGQSATLLGNVTSDAGFTFDYRWAAAAYSNLVDAAAPVVKAVDDARYPPFLNSHLAGTPENDTPFVVPGARGDGSPNFTGTPNAPSDPAFVSEPPQQMVPVTMCIDPTGGG